MNVSPIPTFDDFPSAQEWMEDQVDDPFQDNDRFAFSDDQEAVEKYEMVRCSGCCGSFDAVIIIDGREATIGCNYGH